MQLTDLLKEIEETINNLPFISWQFFFNEVKENPEDYSLTEIGERKETREIEKDDIPKKGKIITYADNDFYSQQEEKFKSTFPELATEEPSAIAEKVIGIRQFNNKVGLTIKRYLIKKKQIEKLL